MNISVTLNLRSFAGWPRENIAAFFAGLNQVFQAQAEPQPEARSEAPDPPRSE